MNGLVLGSMLAAGALGSFHCAAMCGPFATLAGRRGVFGSLRYSLGRLSAYAMLGGLAGSLGAGVNASLAGLEHASAILAVVAGAGLVVFGLGSLGPARGRIRDGGPLAPLYASLVPLIRAAADARRSGNEYVLGVLNGLLPCPVTTPVLLAALASGSAVVGSGLLLALGLGTLPTMLLAGVAGHRLVAWATASGEGTSRLTTRLGRHVPALAMIGLGLVTAVRPFLQASAPHLHGT